MRTVTAFIVAMLLIGCDDAAQSENRVTMFAAASTQDAVNDVLGEFATDGAARAATEITTNYGNSATLAKQIEAGAEAGVFLSASRSWADYLEERGLVRERLNLLSNRLVVIVPADSKLEIGAPQDLATAPIERLALADFKSAPAVIYAKQALEKLNLWDQLEPKVVSGSDVREAVLYVEKGEADAGIVYATDVANLAADPNAAANRKVKVVLELDPALTEPIVYTLMLVKLDVASELDEKLFDFLTSPTALDTFRRHGFIPLQKPSTGEIRK